MNKRTGGLLGHFGAKSGSIGEKDRIIVGLPFAFIVIKTNGQVGGVAEERVYLDLVPRRARPVKKRSCVKSVFRSNFYFLLIIR